MRFFLRWIIREVQNDGWWVSLFVLSMGIGLFGFVSLETFRAGLDQALRLNARNFLSADLAASSRRKIAESELTKMRQVVSPEKESHLVEFFSMAASRENSRLVQIKAIDANYPLYGEMKLGSGKVIRSGDSNLLEESAIAWVYPEVLSQLQIELGGKIRIGASEFTVQDTIEDDSTQTFRLGGLAPKIYFSEKFLPQTGLVAFGTTLSDVYLFKVAGEDQKLMDLATQLQKEFPDPNLQFSTPFDSAEDSARTLQTLLDYLGLVSLVGLALALVGIGYLLQLFLARRVSTLSLLRTLGLQAGKAELFLLLELCLLGLLAMLLVLPLVHVLLPGLTHLLADFLPIPVTLKLNLTTVALSFLLVTLLPVLIAWPLLRPLRRVSLKQVLLDRQLWRALGGWKDRLTWFPALLLFLTLAIWVSHSIKVASIFFGALLGSAVLIILISVILLKILPKRSGWMWHQARVRLMRAPLRFSVVILALAFGTLLLVLIPQIRESLKEEIASPESTRLPSLFLFDIQDEQKDPLIQLLNEQGLHPDNVSPLVRSRLLAVNGVPFERKEKKAIESREEEREARFRNRGINLTYRGELTKTEELMEGRRFSSVPGEIAEVSVEYRYAERLGLHVGDLLKFDIQGIEMDAKIVNLRSVKWNSFQPNFFISFQPGFLEEAPKIWLVSVPPLKEEKKTDLQNSLVKQFPNVSIVDVSRVVKKIMELTDQMTIALAAMAILSVLVGLFVLLTVLLTEARSRLLEWNLLKVLGASEESVLRIFLMESTVISLISVVLGGLLGTLVSWILVWVLFEAPFRFAWEFFLLALGLPFVFSILLSFQLGRRLTCTSAASLLAEGRL